MNKKIIILICILIVGCIATALLLQKKEAKEDNLTEYQSAVEKNNKPMTVNEAEEYQNDMEEKQTSFYSNCDYSLNLSAYDICQNMDESFSITAGDMYSYESHGKLVTALAERYGIETNQIILTDMEYDEENMVFASIISVGDTTIKAYFEDETAYVKE